MKPETKEDIFLHEKLERLDEFNSEQLKKQIREAKRKIKRAIAKTRRNSEKKVLRDMVNLDDDE